MDNSTVASIFETQTGILPRPRVNALLAEASRHALVAVTAGTGYGKSRSVAAFLAQVQGESLWVQLTGMDNFTPRFWEIFTHALQVKEPELARRMQNMGFPDTLEKRYQFIKALEAAMVKYTGFFLVFDDFHKIEDRDIIDLVEMIAFARIPALRMFLLSRQPLRIHYSSLYDNGLLARVSVADLRFTEEESASYLAMIGLEADAQLLRNIQTSTEGWPLAIYLIGLHRKNDGQLFNDPIACTIPLLYSLIDIEIFSAYDEELQKAFVRLAMLESVPLELLKQLAGSAGSNIEAAMKNNMFVYYNPHAGQYHFHRLFRRFLREKQGQLPPEQKKKIYRLAGDWYKQNRRSIEALNYYAKCEDYESEWEIIRRYGEEGYSAEIAELCLDILNRFPPEYIEQRPVIQVFRGHLILNVGEVESAHQTFLDIVYSIESLPETAERRAVLGEAYIGLAHTSILRKDYAFSTYYHKADECLPNGSSILTHKHEFVGNHNALFLFDHKPGSLKAMVERLFEVRPAADRAMNGCGYGVEYLTAAEAAFYSGDGEGTLVHAHKAMFRAREKEQHDIVCACYFLMVRVYFAKGEYAKVRQYLAEMRAYAKAQKTVYTYGVDDIADGWFYARIEQLDKVPAWILANDGRRYKVGIAIGREQLVQVLCALLKGEYTALLARLGELEAHFSAAGTTFGLLQLYIAKSICQLRLGNGKASADALRQAYDLAYHNNLCMLFIEYGWDTRDVVDNALAQPRDDMDTGWLQKLRDRASGYEEKRQSIIAACAADT